jgi:hypothetical protein
MIQRLFRSLTGISFQRGLALGAMVGAAIAGSTLWNRIRAAREEATPERGPDGRIEADADKPTEALD